MNIMLVTVTERTCIRKAIGAAAAGRWFGMPVEFTLWPALVALAVTGGVGVASGLYPAWKAAKLPPVEALRLAGA